MWGIYNMIHTFKVVTYSVGKKCQNNFIIEDFQKGLDKQLLTKLKINFTENDENYF